MCVADTGKKGCFTRTFRQYVLDVNPGIKLPGKGEWGFAKGPGSEAFVFRRGDSKNYTQQHMIEKHERVTGDGQFPINATEGNAAYSWWLRKMRKALVECCGLTTTAAAKYGSHMCKRGGITAMERAGASKSQRKRAAGWRTDMDKEYLQVCIEEDLEYSKATGV
jgi:hypothetical protein